VAQVVECLPGKHGGPSTAKKNFFFKEKEGILKTARKK
jgi:hypothetical protein